MTSRSTTARTRLAATALACGLCLGTAAPYALAATPASAADIIAGVKYPTGEPDASTDGPAIGESVPWLLDAILDGNTAIVIVTPGTDDTGLHPRINPIVGDRHAAYVAYPESFWPIIGGKADTPLGLPFFAPTYAASRTIAENGNLEIMRALKAADYNGFVVYTGYSQGAEALGNAAETASQEGLLGKNSLILLVSDPRSPWGIKGFGKSLPLSDLWVTPALGLIGIDNNGARDPQAAGDVQVVSVIVQGDPVADWQWNWLRPGSSLLVNAAGFIAIHSPGDGPYGHLDGSQNQSGHTLITGGPTLLSGGGNTTYAVYDTYHPLALLNAMIYDAVGIKYGESDLKRWDEQAELFYPMTDVADKKPFGSIQVSDTDVTPPVFEAPASQESSSFAARIAGSDTELSTFSTAGEQTTREKDVRYGKHRRIDSEGQWAESLAGPTDDTGRHRKVRPSTDPQVDLGSGDQGSGHAADATPADARTTNLTTPDVAGSSADQAELGPVS